MLRLFVLLVLLALAALIVVKLVKGLGAGGPARGRGPTAKPDAKLVRCGACGAYVPRSDALPAPDGFRCTDPKCRESGARAQ